MGEKTIILGWQTNLGFFFKTLASNMAFITLI
jgi:hypothetical protein